ncbi:DUF3298 and DUF4163 domain-containing protein [Pararhodonellum marinum]|uniref:DUF3298 and DUF4163 domain-containing protein n=1 Tax=Pararhodonellum marinum TaxID=2755358 RepID=UPI001890831F|nr:DUF3298 and DUF4163 domain-containing protein [Pararhodonellum marinum]
MKNHSLIFLFFVICIFSCTPKGDMKYEMVDIEEKSCVDEQCATVEISYPKFTGRRNRAKRVNQHVQEQLKMYIQLGEPQEWESVEKAINFVLEAHEIYMRDYPESTQEWTMEVNGKVGYQSDEILSLLFTNYSYTGGAHPIGYQIFLNFNKKTGELLNKADFVGDEAQLKKLTERAFRKIHRVEEDIDLKDDPRFFLNEGEFFLPVSMGFDQNDFVLIYNPYEIGPYVMGSTEIRFNLAELEEVLTVY